MKFNRIIFFLSLIILFNCKIEKKVNILKLAELSNYKITETHINNSVIRINGDNKNYLLEGNINAHDKSKQGWWKIKNKVSDEEYRIEYIFLDEQIANQIKIYKKGKFYKKASKFYNTSFDKNGFNFNFHFPSSKFDSKLVTFDYSKHGEAFTYRVFMNDFRGVSPAPGHLGIGDIDKGLPYNLKEYVNRHFNTLSKIFNP